MRMPKSEFATQSMPFMHPPVDSLSQSSPTRVLVALPPLTDRLRHLARRTQGTSYLA